MVVWALGAVIFAAMVAEALVSRRHDAALRARGAVEPPGDVIAAMQLAYPGVFLAMIGEGIWRGGGAGPPEVGGGARAATTGKKRARE